MPAIILRDLDEGPTAAVLFDPEADFTAQTFPEVRIGKLLNAPKARGLFTRASGEPCVIFLDGDAAVFRIRDVSCHVRPGVSSRFEGGIRKRTFELRVDGAVAFRIEYPRPQRGLKHFILDFFDTSDDALQDGMNVMDSFINHPERLREVL